jgi:hypothetical protein
MIITESEKPNLDFKIDKSVLEGVTDIDLDIFPSHFTVIIKLN